MCDFKLDLALIMDSSDTIPSEHDWIIEKHFMMDVTSQFRVIGPAGVRVSCFIHNCKCIDPLQYLFSPSYKLTVCYTVPYFVLTIPFKRHYNCNFKQKYANFKFHSCICVESHVTT